MCNSFFRILSLPKMALPKNFVRYGTTKSFHYVEQLVSNFYKEKYLVIFQMFLTPVSYCGVYKNLLINIFIKKSGCFVSGKFGFDSPHCEYFFFPNQTWKRRLHDVFWSSSRRLLDVFKTSFGNKPSVGPVLVTIVGPFKNSATLQQLATRHWPNKLPRSKYY